MLDARQPFPLHCTLTCRSPLRLPLACLSGVVHLAGHHNQTAPPQLVPHRVSEAAELEKKVQQRSHRQALGGHGSSYRTRLRKSQHEPRAKHSML